jgi:hypothetical protein
MDSDRVNRWLTFATNVGVIVGIVFLALELRQNSQLMAAQLRQQMSRDTTDLLTLHSNDAQYLTVIERGLKGEELTDVESHQFVHRQNAYIWQWQQWQNLVYQHRIGLYDDDEFALQIAIARRYISDNPGFLKLWCEYKNWIASPELIEMIESGSPNVSC